MCARPFAPPPLKVSPTFGLTEVCWANEKMLKIKQQHMINRGFILFTNLYKLLSMAIKNKLIIKGAKKMIGFHCLSN